jgi:hypothetical protein
MSEGKYRLSSLCATYWKRHAIFVTECNPLASDRLNIWVTHRCVPRRSPLPPRSSRRGSRLPSGRKDTQHLPDPEIPGSRAAVLEVRIHLPPTESLQTFGPWAFGFWREANGPAARIREGVEQWRDAGITTPVLVPLSPDGSQMNAAPAWRRISPAAGRST